MSKLKIIERLLDSGGLDDFDRAIRMIKELESRTQWRDIETAPKDGTEVFIFHKGWEQSPVAKWGDYPGNPVVNQRNEDCDMEGWIFHEWFTPGNEDGFLGWDDDEMPTHWMPLPEAPKED